MIGTSAIQIAFFKAARHFYHGGPLPSFAPRKDVQCRHLQIRPLRPISLTDSAARADRAGGPACFEHAEKGEGIPRGRMPANKTALNMMGRNPLRFITPGSGAW
jgi:hypothetical protein